MDQWPGGVERVILDSVDSTMSEAARRAASITAPTWIMAHSQTAARGRRGRAWVTPAGNLNATLIFKPKATAAEAVQRSFVAANALFDALSIYVPAETLAQKWPNDVLLRGGKVAGILLESSGQGGHIDWLSIGIGVNLRHTPEAVRDAAFAPTSLKAAGGWDVEPFEFLGSLASAYAAQEEHYMTKGFAYIREGWLKNAARLGEIITARTSHSEITGIFDTIDAAGNLVLITGAGRQTIPAADVYF